MWIDTNILPKETVRLENKEASYEDAAMQLQGQFGDKFGAINALFSGLAFAGVIFTIIIQTREINNTNESFQSQLKTQQRQRFDSIFFQLLTLHSEITSKLIDLQHNGRHSFKSFHERLLISDPEFAAYGGFQKLEREQVRFIRDNGIGTQEIRARLEEADISNIESALAMGRGVCDNYLDESNEMQERRIKVAYTKAATLHIDNYSHYFRNLYHILRFLDQSDLIEIGEKDLYAKIIRSQLSDIELVALFYNSITHIELPGRASMELGFPKMGKLLVRFDILQNMSPRSLIHPSHKEIFNRNNKAQ